MIDIKRLAYFIHVAGTQNISTSAEALHISHQGLSYQIKALEKEIGAELFERSSNKIELTDAGRKTYELFSPVIQMIDEKDAALNDYILQKKSFLRIAYFNGFSYTKVVGPIIRGIEKQIDDIKIELLSTDIGTAYRMIREGSLDAGILPVQEGEHTYGFENKSICPIPLKILVSNNHPWSSKEKLTEGDLEEGQLLVYDHRQSDAFDNFMPGLKVKKRVYVKDFDNYMRTLSQGETFGINFKDFSPREWEMKSYDIPSSHLQNMNIALVYQNSNFHYDTIRKIEF